MWALSHHTCTVACYFLLHAATRHNPCTHRAVHEAVVNWWRPGNASERGTRVPAPDLLSHSAILANDSLPGPAVHATVNQIVSVTVINQLPSSILTIHWHGIDQAGTPWSDGTPDVSQCAVPPGGGTYTYTFKATQAGTFYWHANVGQLQVCMSVCVHTLEQERERGWGKRERGGWKEGREGGRGQQVAQAHQV